MILNDLFCDRQGDHYEFGVQCRHGHWYFFTAVPWTMVEIFDLDTGSVGCCLEETDLELIAEEEILKRIGNEGAADQ